MTTLSIDFGASNIRAGIVSKTKISNFKKVKTPKTKAKILKALYSLIDSYKPLRPSKICVGVAAFIKNGNTNGTPNMDFNNVPLQSLLKKRYNLPVYTGNDANSAGLAEKYFGLGKGKKNFILLTLGTGIGGAIIINHRLYKGNGQADEVGHIIIDHNKSLENLASGPASVRLAHKSGFKHITSLELEKLANKGSKKAKAIYKQIGHYIGLGILSVANILDPEIIILGGGFAKVKHIWPEIRSVLHNRDLMKRNIPIVHAKLSDNAGLIGAALLPKELR